ncbi:hypothetical protein B0H14DRAFT_3469381 [Mycena olivaceomarginata]|nr:hypothetical protein B0H14DRAFT_3469381 [Mycena olivaceomarginata]
MSGLPDVLKIPDGSEKLSLPPNNLPVSSLIKFQLPPQRKSTVFADPTDYLSELPPTITTFNVRVAPPHIETVTDNSQQASSRGLYTLISTPFRNML